MLKNIFSKTTVIILVILLLSTGLSAAEPVDISNHWAQDYILNLLNRDIMQIYNNSTFRPDQNITREEFAAAFAKQLNLLPSGTNNFTDLQTHNPEHQYINALSEEQIMEGYPDNNFKPNKAITRAELISTIIRGLGVKDETTVIRLDDYNPFSDIDNNHWALYNIKLAHKLELIDGTAPDIFNPDKQTTRAEAAKILTNIAQLNSGSGYLTDVYPSSNKISMNLLDGNREVYDFTDETLIARNNRRVSPEQILQTDETFFIASSTGEIKYMKAYGMVTQNDLTAEVSTMTNGFLNTEDVEQLSQGNLDILKPKVQTAVREELLRQGLSAEEIKAIMSTEWGNLEDLSKTRLSEAIAIQTGLPLDITRSLINGDWERLRSYAQVELIQRLFQEVISSDLLS